MRPEIAKEQNSSLPPNPDKPEPKRAHVVRTTLPGLQIRYAEAIVELYKPRLAIARPVPARFAHAHQRHVHGEVREHVIRQ